MTINPTPAQPSPLISLENISVHVPVREWSSRPLKSRFDMIGRAYAMAQRTRWSPILQHVWLDLKPGQRVGIIGPNGSGKSTLLKLLAGALPQSGGRAYRRGKIVAILSSQAGFVMQATGYENIFLRGLMLGMSRREISDRIDDIIEFADIGKHIYEPIGNYSSGMLLRLAFAISTAFDAEVLLIDEWIGTGDAEFLEKARARLEAVVANSRILVLASHNSRVIRSFCNEAVLMLDGQIAHRGDVDTTVDIYRHWLETQKGVGG
jgi:ABC-2 type transport system ATP-binding protein